MSAFYSIWWAILICYEWCVMKRTHAHTITLFTLLEFMFDTFFLSQFNSNWWQRFAKPKWPNFVCQRNYFPARFLFVLCSMLCMIYTRWCCWWADLKWTNFRSMIFFCSIPRQRIPWLARKVYWLDISNRRRKKQKNSSCTLHEHQWTFHISAHEHLCCCSWLIVNMLIDNKQDEEKHTVFEWVNEDVKQLHFHFIYRVKMSRI